jgi:hypothetical protein
MQHYINFLENKKAFPNWEGFLAMVVAYFN